MQYIKNTIEEQLEEMQATYQKKHAAFVESQRRVIEKYVTEALEKAHSRVNAYTSQSRDVIIIIPAKEFYPLQPETAEMLESLSFTFDVQTGQWFAEYQW